MKIVWSRFAVKNLRDIYEYYAENAGPSIALKIRNGIFEEGKKLVNILLPHKFRNHFQAYVKNIVTF